MQIRRNLKLPKASTPFETALVQELQSAWQELSELVNGGLKGADNFNREIVTVADTGAADTQFTVAHTLRRTPSTFRVISNDKAGVVYKSGTWSDTFVYFKCSVASCNITIELE